MSDAVPPASGPRDGDAGGGPHAVQQAGIPIDEGVAVPPLRCMSRLEYSSLFTPNSPPGRSGNLVIAYDGSHLGMNCPICNQPGEHVIRTRFSWHPQWAVFFILPLILSFLGLVAVGFMMHALVKCADISYVLCPEHHRLRRRWQVLGRSFIFLASILGILIVIFGRGSGLNFAWAALLSVVLMLIVAVVAFQAVDRLKAIKVADKTARLKGAGQAFLDTLPYVALPD